MQLIHRTWMWEVALAKVTRHADPVLHTESSFGSTPRGLYCGRLARNGQSTNTYRSQKILAMRLQKCMRFRRRISRSSALSAYSDLWPPKYCL